MYSNNSTVIQKNSLILMTQNSSLLVVNSPLVIIFNRLNCTVLFNLQTTSKLKPAVLHALHSEYSNYVYFVENMKHEKRTKTNTEDYKRQICLERVLQIGYVSSSWLEVRSLTQPYSGDGISGLNYIYIYRYCEIYIWTQMVSSNSY